MTPWIPRSAGVLLHPSSLPSGRLDDDAQRFADWLVEAGFSTWQLLPVGPLDGHGSPYQPNSSVAGRGALFDHLPLPEHDECADFAARNTDWLPDYALFTALCAHHQTADWTQWPIPLRDRDPAALDAARSLLAEPIALAMADQCRFDRGWRAFKHSVNARGLRLFGDVPLFLAHHSADIWARRELFEVDPDGQPGASMGVPPDAFSDDGQWWGYPPYRWAAMAAEDYAWWRRRFDISAERFDLIRIDHFRGLVAFWRIPRDAETAKEGRWTPGPGRECVDALQQVLGNTQLVAEDLGYITDDVVAVRKALGIPGMRVLQFAFDGDPASPHLPVSHNVDTVCYTGTHDNDTTLGWWQHQSDASQQYIGKMLGILDPQMPDELVRFAWTSPGALSIVPLQDLLGLDSTARMNQPGTLNTRNWQWRFDWDQFPNGLATRLRAELAAQQRLIQDAPTAR